MPQFMGPPGRAQHPPPSDARAKAHLPGERSPAEVPGEPRRPSCDPNLHYCAPLRSPAHPARCPPSPPPLLLSPPPKDKDTETWPPWAQLVFLKMSF